MQFPQMTPVEQILDNFQSYLTSSGSNYSTKKNYLSDLRHFFNFVTSRHQYISTLTIPFILTPQLVQEYRQTLLYLPVSTGNRRLSSLRKFCQFAYATKLLIEPISPLPSSLPPDATQIVSRYKKYLQSQGVSPNTIKNYLSDIKSTALSSEYNLSASTIKRRQSSLNNFLSWRHRSTPPTIPTPQSNSSSNKLLIFSIIFAIICSTISLLFIFKSNAL